MDKYGPWCYPVMCPSRRSWGSSVTERYNNTRAEKQTGSRRLIQHILAGFSATRRIPSVLALAGLP